MNALLPSMGLAIFAFCFLLLISTAGFAEDLDDGISFSDGIPISNDELKTEMNTSFLKANMRAEEYKLKNNKDLDVKTYTGSKNGDTYVNSVVVEGDVDGDVYLNVEDSGPILISK